MLNIGMGEMALILIAALVVLGPDRLPDFARTLGKFVREFRRQTDDVRGVVMREIYKLESEADLEGRRTLAPVRPSDETIAPPHVAAGLLSAAPLTQAAPGIAPDLEPALATGEHPESIPGAAGDAALALSATSRAGSAATAPDAASTSLPAAAAPNAAPPPAARTAEAKVTVVDGIRIAPASGTVARGAARAAPAPSTTTNASAADLPPTPTTPQS